MASKVLHTTNWKPYGSVICNASVFIYWRQTSDGLMQYRFFMYIIGILDGTTTADIHVNDKKIDTHYFVPNPLNDFWQNTHDENDWYTVDDSGISTNVSITFNATGGTSATVSGTVPLPHFGSLKSESIWLGEEHSLEIQDYRKGYTYRLEYSFGGQVYTVADNATEASVTWTPPVDRFGPSIDSRMYVGVPFYVTTIFDGEDINDSTYAIIYVWLREADAMPSVSAVLSDPTGYKTKYGKYVLGQSMLHGEVTPALKYGATVSAISVKANGQYFSTASFTTAVLASMEYKTVEITLTDSRGLTASASLSVDIIEWYQPKITAFSIHRTNEDGSANDSGGYCRIDWGIQVAPVADKNSRLLTINQPQGQSKPTLTAYTQSGSLVVAASTESSYDISIELKDDFATTVRTLRLSTAGVVLDILRGGKGIGLGKVAEVSEAVELNPEWTFICRALELGGVDLKQWMADIDARLKGGGL